MDDNMNIEQIVKEVMKMMNNEPKTQEVKLASNSNPKKLTLKDYPLAIKSKELIKTKNGKGLDDIDVKSVLSGDVKDDDIKITSEVLLYQAQIADEVGRAQFGKNLRRAAEMVIIPDARVLEIYSALRPFRSTKQELLDIATELDDKYNATINATLVREAADVYEKRSRLKV
ncbi:diol dehydratase small subunit [Clostridium estertheticum]|uniref:Diol dehydratase small subunit n=1 Tax=Clostridium estertheticum TaxID=238834 RepID=A0A7Y3WTE1_9CLOT|nr:diol dehydratase small subunit [Clostridium estertheticum]NNU76919.1 diol dehydratase small subunit [Clostridium estertheticum]WBL48788.1 diol dehydratase small subunit [Clostridium estertheticum]